MLNGAYVRGNFYGKTMLFKNYKKDLTPLVFAVFAFTGGFLEAFTFVLHGGVFCNAQTGNVVMLVIDFVRGDFSGGLRYLYSILAYIVGIILSTVIPSRFKKVNWYLVVTALELIALAGVAFIPESASDWFTYVTVAFVCSVQYNTFTKLHGVALATTFCTNNIRQTVMHFMKGVSEKSREEYKKSGIYAFIILCFAAGAAVGARRRRHRQLLHLNLFGAPCSRACIVCCRQRNLCKAPKGGSAGRRFGRGRRRVALSGFQPSVLGIVQ